MTNDQVVAFEPSQGLSNLGAEQSSKLFIGAIVFMACMKFQSIIEYVNKAEHNYDRSELLAAYRQRHSWRRSDIKRLRTLSLNGPALRRLEKLEGKGRPVVQAHQPLAEKIVRSVHSFANLFSQQASPQDRRAALKEWPWWDHRVEAMYRSEHQLAKQAGIPDSSGHAERTVGKALGLSSSSVHAICNKIRKMRKDDPESANFPPMALKDYEQFIETGDPTLLDFD